MNSKRNRRIALVIAVLMLTMAFSTTGFAAWMGKTLDAQYRNISIFVNNEFKQAKTEAGVVVEPFIVDGTTYVPLRGIAEMLGYQVTFNNQTYRIDVTGNIAGSDPSAQYEILMLEAKIAELEAKLADKEDSSMDLGDLEDELNDDYKRIRKVDVEDIKLKGDEDDIEVRVYIDTKSSSQWDAWKDLKDSDIEDFLQDIVDDILDEFKKADISGYIEDEYDGKKVEKFGITKKGIVDLGGGSSVSGDLGDMEDELNDDYKRIRKVVVEDIKLKGDEDDIEVQIYIDTKSSSQWDAWKDLKDSDIEDFLQEIVDDILDEFKDADITGYIEDEYDGKKVEKFDIDKKGNVNF